MKKYEAPEIEIIKVRAEDVIKTSGLNKESEGTFNEVIEWT